MSDFIDIIADAIHDADGPGASYRDLAKAALEALHAWDQKHGWNSIVDAMLKE